MTVFYLVRKSQRGKQIAYFCSLQSKDTDTMTNSLHFKEGKRSHHLHMVEDSNRFTDILSYHTQIIKEVSSVKTKL